MNMSIEALFLCSNFQQVGTYVRAYEIAKNLAKRGHKMTLVAVSRRSKIRTQEFVDSNLKVILTGNLWHDDRLLNRLTSSPGWGLFDILERIRIGRRGHFNIIHLFDHFPNVSFPFHYLRTFSKAKFVSDWCDVFHLPGGFRDTYRYRLDTLYRLVGCLPRYYLRKAELNIRRCADAVITISNPLKHLASGFGLDPNKIAVLSGGADVDRIKQLPKYPSRKKVGLPIEGKIVMFLGQSQFDLEILISSFAMLRRRVPNSYLVVIGTRLHKWPRELAERYGLKDGFIETGYCPDDRLPEMLASADVFALPMKDNLVNRTRWPNKVGEYLAAGRPVVASAVGDAADLLNRRKAGLTCVNDATAFSAKLEEVINNPFLAEELGHNARQLACEQLSWAIIAEKLENIYYTILKS